jgi:hypothetical protein
MSAGGCTDLKRILGRGFLNQKRVTGKQSGPD